MYHPGAEDEAMEGSMMEIQERLELAGILSRLDDLIRRGRRHPDSLLGWRREDRGWFADLLYPVPPAKPVTRLVATDEPAPPVTIIAALLHENYGMDELRRELEQARQLWTTLQADEPLPKAAVSEIVRLGSVLRRFFLDASPISAVSAGLASLAPSAA